jgi:hypothetical protein
VVKKEQVYRDNEKAVEAHVKARNEALLSGDLDRVMEFQKKHNPEFDWGSMPRISAEAGMHKAITAVTDLPRPHRMKSKQWLREHGFHSLDDGDLNDA